MVVDVDALLLRQHLYALQTQADALAAHKNTLAQRTRLERNASEVQQLLVDERVARQTQEEERDHAWGALLAFHGAAHEREALQQLATHRMQARCDARYDARESAARRVDESREALERQRGAEQMRQERERSIREAHEREAAVVAKRQRAEMMRAARAYIAGSETRDRASVTQEEVTAMEALRAAELRGRDEANALAYERFINSDEQKQIVAERERKAAEERAAALRKEAEFRRDQGRMVKNCTHSRAGTSVFLGPLAKKMCLICKVKFDDSQGIYIRMP